MNLQLKYQQDKDGNKYAPVTVPQGVVFPDGSNISDKLSALESVLLQVLKDKEDNEKVTAQALNDLNDRINACASAIEAIQNS